MDLLSVEEAFMYALEAVGKEYEYIVAGTAVLRTVPEIMEANGWIAMKNTAGEILYYTRPAQAVLETGVKTYTEVAEVTAVTTESGAITSATVTTSGVGVSVATGALACAAAASYGYNIGNQIYDVNPDFWDGMLEEVNEWTVENVPEGGVNAIVTVLDGVDSVLTFPSDLLTKLKIYALDKGVFDSVYDINVPSETSGNINVSYGPISFDFVSSSYEKIMSHDNYDSITVSNGRIHLKEAYEKLLEVYGNLISSGNANYIALQIYKFDNSSFSLQLFLGYVPETMSIQGYGSNSISNYRILSPRYALSYVSYFVSDTIFRYDGNSAINKDAVIGFVELSSGTWFVTSLNGTSEPAQKGISLQEDATYPDADSPISTTYPDWWNKALTINNGTGGSTSWLPMSITDKNAEYFGDPQSQPEAQSGTKTNPANNTNIQVIDSSGVLDIPNNPDSDDKGDTPAIFPLTSIFGIAGVYNPTADQLKSFSNWLWTADPITQLQQMFSNPMNAIIGLHSIYVTPHTSETRAIGVGYLSSGVQSKVVDEQYVTVDCGTVEIPSYFNNVNDWNPYTKISCYLPFIGIVDLNTDDIMSSAGKQCMLNITYKVDVLTGACLCMLTVKRGSIDAVLYQYNGSCSVQLPLTSGNYGTMLASLITTAVGVATGIGGVAIGGAISMLHSKANIQRSGQLGSNVGAMGIKKPYLIIERPYSKYAGSYSKHIGYPSNNTVTLSSCSGFTRVKASNVTNINTTEEERNMIYELLKNGVYV